MGISKKTINCIVLTLVGFIAAIYTMAVYVPGYEKVPFFMLPFAYAIFSFIVYSQYNCKVGPGFIAISVIIFSRYILLPISICSNGSVSSMAKTYSHLSFAIWIMVFELICVGCVLYVSRRKYRRQEVQNQDDFQEMKILKNSSLMALIVALFIVGVAIVYKDYRSGFNLLLSNSVYQSSKDSMSNGLSIVWSALSVWLYIYFVITDATKQRKGLKKPSAFKSIVFTLIFVALTFLDQSSLSRWYTIITAAASVALLLKMFPNNKKQIFISIGIPVFLLLIFATLLKNGGFNSDGVSFSRAISKVLSPSSMDVYFSGPVNVNNAIDLKASSKLNITCIVNDILNNMPIVNHFLDPSKASVYQFNASLGRIFGNTGDQIIPLIGQGMIYFGYIFSPLLSILITKLMVRFDLAYLKSNSYITYVYGFCAIWLSAICMMLNLTILMAWVYIRIVPFFIVTYLTDKFSQR